MNIALNISLEIPAASATKPGSIRYFRGLRGLTQREFAKRIGVSNSRTSNWEQGINRPDADILSAICQVLQISADELLDIQLKEVQLTDEERRIVAQYRSKPELQQAVRILLGLER